MPRRDIEIASAAGVPRGLLAAALDRAFEGYEVPVHFSEAVLEALVEREDVAIGRSYVAYREGELVAVALVAVRPSEGGPRARLAAMGVVPEGRRMGIGRALVGRVIDDARAMGARDLVLEVLEANAGARLLYERQGFAPARRLLGFSFRAAPRPVAPGGVLHGARVALRPTSGPELLALFARCLEAEPPEARPPWQLDAPALARLAPSDMARAIVASCAGDSAVGYVALSPERPTARLLHLGVLPGWRRRGIAGAALAAVCAIHPAIEEMHVPPLVPEASTLVPFLRARGATETRVSQIEMALPLSPCHGPGRGERR